MAVGIIHLDRGINDDAKVIVYDCNDEVSEWEKLGIIQHTSGQVSFRLLEEIVQP